MLLFIHLLTIPLSVESAKTIIYYNHLHTLSKTFLFQQNGTRLQTTLSFNGPYKCTFYV